MSSKHHKVLKKILPKDQHCFVDGLNKLFAEELIKSFAKFTTKMINDRNKPMRVDRDTWNFSNYKCPNCTHGRVCKCSRFCSDCGIKIDWSYPIENGVYKVRKGNKWTFCEFKDGGWIVDIERSGFAMKYFDEIGECVHSQKGD